MFKCIMHSTHSICLVSFLPSFLPSFFPSSLSMTLGTINEDSTFGPGTPSVNGNMTVSTMGTNYTSKTTTRADINGRPFDVDSKAGICRYTPKSYLLQPISSFYSIRFVSDADLRSMNESRQQAIEMITEERARLAERVNILEKQKLASKARIKGTPLYFYIFCFVFLF